MFDKSKKISKLETEVRNLKNENKIFLERNVLCSNRNDDLNVEISDLKDQPGNEKEGNAEVSWTV